MNLSVRPMVAWLTIFLLAIFPVTVFGQSRPQFRTGQPPPILDPPPASSGNGAGFTGTEGLTTMPPDAFLPDRPAIQPALLFRNTQFPNGSLLTPMAVGPEIHSESVNGGFKLTLPGIGGGVPWLQRGFEPQDADLKIGPLFFKLRELEVAILHSDNINLTPDHRESGTIGIVGVTVDVVAQLTETLRLATSGTFVYLPFDGKAGIAGFGLNEIYAFGLAAGPLIRGQLTWDTQIGGWNVVFTDEFQVSEGYYSDDIHSDRALFTGGHFNDESVAGRYALRPNEGSVFGNPGPNRNDTNFRNDVVVYSNTASAGIDRLLPGTIRLSARAYVENLWYNQGNRGLPSIREGASIGLACERENMRFKPYIIFDTFHTDEFAGWQNIIRLGISGPITDQLRLSAEVGYYFGGIQDDSGGLWRVELDHTAGPNTQESVFYAREFNYFHDEIDELVGYNIHQVLGPKIDSDAYIYRVLAEYLYNDGNRFSQNEWRAGLRFTYTVGPKTTLRLTGEYDRYDPNTTAVWTGRADLGYNFTDTLLLHFVYQYQQSKSDIFNNNYTENLFFLSLSKYFN